MSRKPRLQVQSLESREVPAGDLAYAVALAGMPGTANLRVVGDPVGNTYVSGTFTGSIDLNPSPTVTAMLTSRGAGDAFVAKYGFNGELVWARQLGGQADDKAVDLALDGIGNVYVGGTFKGAVDFNPAAGASSVLSAAANGAAFVWKLDYAGKFVMARAVGGTSTLTDLDVDPAGRILATGQYANTADFDPGTATANLTTTAAEGSSYVWKLDAAGNYSWAKSSQSTGPILTSNVILDPNGFAYLAGRFTGTADLDPAAATKNEVAAGSNWTPFLTKLGFAGEHLWSRTLKPTTATGSQYTAITGLQTDGIGNVYAAGVFAGSVDFDPGTGIVALQSEGTATDGFVWKLTPAGVLGYARRFGGNKAETVADLGVHTSGQVFVTGTYTGVADFDPGAGIANLTSGAGASDVYVLKLNAQGNIAYTRSLGGGGSVAKSTGMYSDGAGNFFVVGHIVGVGDFHPDDPLQLLDGKNGAGFIAKISPAATAAVKPGNAPPINVSAGGPYTMKEGEGLTVKATGVDPEGKPLIFNWDLNGDGIFGDAKGWKITLTPAQAALLGLGDGTGATRTIRVRVLDGVNLGPVATTTLTIENQPPTVKINPPLVPPVEGIRPKLSFKVLHDYASKDLKGVYKASWDFNDDGVWDAGDGTTYAGSVPGELKIPMSYVLDSGPLAIRVRVFDKDGGYGEATLTLDIGERAPTAMFSLMGTPRVGMPTAFRFSNQADSQADMAGGFKYAYDFNNDGVFESETVQPQASATFPSIGTYTVRGAIIDKDGTFNVYALTFNVYF